MEYKEKGFPKRLLAGRSARIVVTMGMPVMLYRWYFGAFGVRGFERSILSFAGIKPKPIRESLHGLTFANDKKRARWIEDLGRHGRQGD
jgi:putative NADPH-quinone reductase